MNFAVIGRNFVVDEMLDAMRLFEQIDLYAIYSRNYHTGQAYAQKHGFEVVYTDISELCRDKKIDAVYIASPNCCHEAQAIEIMNSGKHVLCEKPMNATYEGAKRMIDAAQKNNVVFMEAMMSAHVPGTQKIKELMGEIGDIRRCNLSFCQYSSRYDKFKQGIVENAFDPTLQNGSFMDLGVYPVHLMLMLFGEPVDLTSQALFLPKSIDGQGSMLCRYENMQVSLQWSKITQGYLPSEVQGEDGSILIDRVSKPTLLTLVRRNGEREEYETLCGKPVMYYEVRDFLKQLEGEKMPRFNELSLMEAKLMERARAQMGINFNEE